MEIETAACQGAAPAKERLFDFQFADHARARTAPPRRGAHDDQVRTICFVSGTRAEFGLMLSTLRAIQAHPRLQLRIAATGMHLDPEHGRTLQTLAAAGFPADAVVHWTRGEGPTHTAAQTGRAMAAFPEVYDRLNADVVLVVGDRVEAFAAASAAHISGKIVAHVHGGDRALGQVDDALRHAISKLSHLHFAATPGSAQRLIRMGEDRRRVRQVGSPGIDGIRTLAASSRQIAQAFPELRPGRFALIVLHPSSTDERNEARIARQTLAAVRSAGFEQAAIVFPNNDPGSAGIKRCWEKLKPTSRLIVRRDIPRGLFLGLLCQSAALVGNSSSGMIEAASFGTPVVNIGPRQTGREHSANVRHVASEFAAMREALAAIWRDGKPARYRGRNVYDGRGTGRRIAQILAETPLNLALRQKLIAY